MLFNATTFKPWGPRNLSNGFGFIQQVLFFSFFCFSLWHWVDLRLIYHGGGIIANFPVFYWGWDFFAEFLSRPGGIVEYVCALLSQCLFHQALGPLTITALAWSLEAAMTAFLRGVGATPWRLLGYVPPLLLLALYSRYTLHASALLTAATLLAGWLSACCYLRIRPSRFCPRLVLILSGGWLLYLAANGAVLVFGILGFLYELRHPERWRMFPVFLLLAGGTFLAGYWWFGLTPAEVGLGLFPFGLSARVFQSWGLALLYATYLVLPLSVIVWMVWDSWVRRGFLAGPRRVSGSPSPQAASKGKGAHGDRQSKPHKVRPPASASALGKQGVLGWMAVTSLMLFVVAVVTWLALHKEIGAMLRVDFYSYRKMWPQVLEAAKGAPNNLQVMCAKNQALYHSGRLGDDLRLTQDTQTLLLYDHKYRPDWSVIDLYLDLGFVNMAHHYLAEAVDIYGERPSLLERLVLVNAVIGNPGTARIYLNALCRVPFHAAWARDYLRRMEVDSSLEGDEEVARLRKSILKDDHVIPLPVDALMLKLLDRDKNNRMAFEYLMAHCLLTKNLKMFAEQCGRFADFNWGELPRYYQEAIVLAVSHLGLEINLKGRRLADEHGQRHQAFIRKLGAAGSDRLPMAVELQKEYGDSYYYFYYLP